VCTLWTHDENFSKEIVVINEDRFSELPITPGSLIQIVALKQAPAVRDFQPASKGNAKEGSSIKADDRSHDGLPDTHSRRSRRGSIKVTLDENDTVIQGGRDVDPEKSYIFVAKPTSVDLKSKHPTLQVCLAKPFPRAEVDMDCRSLLLRR
jgi:hypothetical protein